MIEELDDLEKAQLYFEKERLTKLKQEEFEKSGGKLLSLSTEAKDSWEILYRTFGEGIPHDIPIRENFVREWWKKFNSFDNSLTKALKVVQEGFIEAMMEK